MLQRPVPDEMIAAHAVLGANTSSAVGGTDGDAFRCVQFHACRQLKGAISAASSSCQALPAPRKHANAAECVRVHANAVFRCRC